MKVVIDDYRLEKMDAYTEPLEAKIRRQAAEITRLLKENEELKRKYEGLNKALNGFNNDVCESARAAGQEEAWELAQKCMLMTDRKREAIFGSGHNALYGVLTYFDYKHAAAKVAEWEKAKEEICVGDVVECEGSYGVVFGAGEVYVKGFTSDLTPFQWMKQSCTKTGRHIDVDAWLAQIGGGSDE